MGNYLIGLEPLFCIQTHFRQNLNCKTTNNCNRLSTLFIINTNIKQNRSNDCKNPDLSRNFVALNNLRNHG
jgi:hypothetical protein